MTHPATQCEPRICPISHRLCTGECIFANVMESQNLGVVVFDFEQNLLLFVNRSARELFARLGQDVEYEDLVKLLHPGEALGGNGEHSRSFTRGSRIIGYTAYASGSYGWALIRDITEKARLESIAEAVESMNNIGYVFSAVRHELGNPINSVKAALSVLRADLSRFSPEQLAEYLDRMAEEVGRVEALLRSLKSFSLFERPEVRPAEIGEIVRAFTHLVGEEAAHRGIALELQAHGAHWAACDPRALQQVLLGLFSNAADALAGRPDPRVALAVASQEGWVSVRVADNGEGMTEEEQQALFQPFHTTKEKGTGLGLVICRRLLAAMGAAISVASRKGSGTTVTLTLRESPRPS